MITLITCCFCWRYNILKLKYKYFARPNSITSNNFFHYMFYFLSSETNWIFFFWRNNKHLQFGCGTPRRLINEEVGLNGWEEAVWVVSMSGGKWPSFPFAGAAPPSSSFSTPSLPFPLFLPSPPTAATPRRRCKLSSSSLHLPLLPFQSHEVKI